MYLAKISVYTSKLNVVRSPLSWIFVNETLSNASIHTGIFFTLTCQIWQRKIARANAPLDEQFVFAKVVVTENHRKICQCRLHYVAKSHKQISMS